MRKVLYIFGQLNDGDVRWLAQTGNRASFSPGEVLLERGVAIDKLLFVLDGELAVRIGDTLVARLGVGEVVGEMSFVDTALPSATVSALTGGTVLAISKPELEREATENPAFGMRFYKAMAIFLADRLRDTTLRLGEGISGEPYAAGELDEKVLDGVSLAGARFERVLREMRGA